MKNTGLPELCAYTQEEYIQKAVELANDKDRLEYLHRNLKRMFMESPICDGVGYMRDLEDNYRRIWQEYLAGDGENTQAISSMETASMSVNTVEEASVYYDALIADLVPGMTKRILVCSDGGGLGKLIKSQYPWAEVVRLQDIGREKLLQDIDVVQIAHFDWILYDGTLEMLQDDARLILALGIHLSPYGWLQCIAMGEKKVKELNKALFGNCFGDIKAEKLGEIHAARDVAYIVFAGKFSGILAWLKQYYTEDIRRDIGFLLSRIDFDIDAEESVDKLKAMCKKLNIQPKYLRTFAETATINKEKVLALLGMQVNI